MKKIHINQQVIRFNNKHDTRLPVIAVQEGGKREYCTELEILDEKGGAIARLVYSPDKPLACGARMWIETMCDVRMIEKCIYNDIRGEMERVRNEKDRL